MTTEENERKRAQMAKDNDPLLYGATVESIEPNIAMIDAGAFYASAAISLKRIADALERLERTAENGNKETAGIARALRDHGPGIPF